MTSKHIGGVLALAALAWAQDSAPKPYHRPAPEPRSYNAPGRGEPDPVGLKQVAIAFFGPPDGADSIWQGASLAIEDANRQGGYHGLPFRLVPAWAKNPWAGGVATLIRVVYADRVWAIIGGIDGATTHLAEQVVPKALLTLVNPAATDRSIHTAYVPWMFSCVPGDHLLAPLVARELKRRGTPFVLLSATDHDSRAFVSELKFAFERDRLAPLLHVEFDPAAGETQKAAGRIVSSGARTAVIVADTPSSVAIVKAARAAGFSGLILSGPLIARAAPDPALAGVLYPQLGDIPPPFRAKFAARYGRAPDYAAAHAYDAAGILVAAIRRAGLNRARIRDAVQALSPWPGITGTIHWDDRGQNDNPARLSVLGGKGG
jgi:branched-chain amino acid transport system substrate-binding protein